MASAEDMIASARKALQRADDLSDVNSSDRETIEWMNTAIARLLQAVERQQAEIESLTRRDALRTSGLIE